MYRDKLGSLKKQLHHLKTGQHQEYNRKLKKIEQAFRERNFFNNVIQNFEVNRI